MRIEPDCFDQPATAVSPAGGVYHSGSTDIFIAGIAVGLQPAFKFCQELLRSLTTSTQPKIKIHTTAGLPVLPQICLMILPAAIMHLHRNRCFIRLNVAVGQ